MIVELLFYVLIACLLVPPVMIVASVLRLIRMGLTEVLLLSPSILLGLIILDMFYIGRGSCFSIWDTACQAIGIIGWIFFLPVLGIIFVLTVLALAMSFARNLKPTEHPGSGE